MRQTLLKIGDRIEFTTIRRRGVRGSIVNANLFGIWADVLVDGTKEPERVPPMQFRVLGLLELIAEAADGKVQPPDVCT